MTKEGWVEINPTMDVDDMNYTQLFMERYRLRHRVPALTAGSFDKLVKRLERVEERLATFAEGAA